MPCYFNDISYIIESDIRQIMSKAKKTTKNKKVRFKSFSSDETSVAKHYDINDINDNFTKMALNLGWNYCNVCSTLVVNVDEDGKCNPPCR